MSFEKLGGEEEMDRKLKPYVRGVVSLFEKIARGEFSNPEIAIREILDDFISLNDNEISLIRNAAIKEFESIYSSNVNNSFGEKLKKAVMNWSDKLFHSVIRIKDVEGVSRNEVILNDVADRIVDAINSEKDLDKIKFAPLFNELRDSVIRSGNGDIEFVTMLGKLPDLVSKIIRNKYSDYRLEQISAVLAKLKEDVTEAIKDETGVHNK